MEQSFSPGTRIELDPIGLYYAAVTSRKYPATFSISAYLREPVVPHVLQQAVNDLMRRLPFLNGRLRRGFFGYYHEILAEPPLIVPARNGHTFAAYFESRRDDCHTRDRGLRRDGAAAAPAVRED